MWKPELNAAEQFASHVLALRHDALPGNVIAAAKTFLLDTLGVGIAGARAPLADAVLKAAAGWGKPDGRESAGVLGRGMKLSAQAAAFVNAFQAHAQEYDCVHEGAVVHPLATVLSALMADAERVPPVDGKTFLAALVGAVDVAAGLGLAARSPLKFFRPATAGIFGCVAGMARLRGLDTATTVSALGHALAFASGTMQAHVEGRPGLPLQIANAARSALAAIDLALAGVPGVEGSIDGPFGYLRLFEDVSDPAPVLDSLGRVFRIAEVSHKPFPTGRAAHGAIVATQTLMSEHGVTADRLERLVYTAPPLIYRLVGRPIRQDLTPNYARLCFPYLGAVTLLRGSVDLADFTPERLADPAVHALATRIEVVADDNPDPAAFVPAVAEARLVDGSVVRITVTAQLGSPAFPLTREQHLDKFRKCLAFGLGAERSAALAEELIARVDALEAENDVASLFARAAMLS